MKTIVQDQAITVIGLALRTNNQEAATTIPPLWARFFSEGILQTIPGKTAADIFAVYTEFEHESVDNKGQYTLVIGAQVAAATPVPPGLHKVTIPAAQRVAYEVETGRMDKVGEKWQEIWADSRYRKTYQADYEHYRESGEISILIGAA